MVDGQTQIPLDVITFFLKSPQESSSNKRNNLYVFYHSDEAKPHRFSLAHTQSDLLFRRISNYQKPFDVPHFLPRLDTSLLYLKTKREREKRGGESYKCLSLRSIPSTIPKGQNGFSNHKQRKVQSSSSCQTLQRHFK